MTIDEAIARYKEITNTDANCPIHCMRSCDKCLQESEQLAEWLEDYKRIKMLIPIEQALKNEYNKAIDDFADKAQKECDIQNWSKNYGISFENLEKISEQLKAGVENEKERNAFDNAKQIVQEVAEEYKGDMKHNLAEMYAKNMVDYGVDVTKSWQTATQQSCALEKAYIRGRQHEIDRFIELRKEYNNGWIPCSGCKDCKNKECD